MFVIFFSQVEQSDSGDREEDSPLLSYAIEISIKMLPVTELVNITCSLQVNPIQCYHRTNMTPLIILLNGMLPMGATQS